VSALAGPNTMGCCAVPLASMRAPRVTMSADEGCPTMRAPGSMVSTAGARTKTSSLGRRTTPRQVVFAVISAVVTMISPASAGAAGTSATSVAVVLPASTTSVAVALPASTTSVAVALPASTTSGRACPTSAAPRSCAVCVSVPTAASRFMMSPPLSPQAASEAARPRAKTKRCGFVTRALLLLR
jgi:hypothetical protein